MVKSLDIEELCTPLIKQLQLPVDFINTVNQIYLPLAQTIVHQQSVAPLLLSINGVQGSGKSTLTIFLKKIIESRFNKNIVEISIDDFYLTHEQRQKLSRTIHPLLKTRGVPGTHDVAFMENVLDDLMHYRPCHIPRFNKLTDDRCAAEQWTTVERPVDIILFEGWCNNSPIQSDKDLLAPVNELEANEDSDGVWRHYANLCLQTYHQRIFNWVDFTIMLQPPSFDCVFQWRKLQEEKARKQILAQAKSGVATEAKQVMNAPALQRFIQHFERISRHTLLHLPKRVDLLLAVNKQHAITEIKHKKN